jgi:hypothetical protein
MIRSAHELIPAFKFGYSLGEIPFRSSHPNLCSASRVRAEFGLIGNTQTDWITPRQKLDGGKE